MAPRTRATASSTPATLATAPRRRLKVTPLDPDETTGITKRNDLNARPATRSTRSSAIPTSDPAPTVLKTTATKPRGRPKKPEAAAEESKSADEPKRVTRSTRATSTTASSEAKEKPAARSRKAIAQEHAIPSTIHEAEPKPKQVEKPTKVPISRKRVTFQDPTEDDKENQPLTRAAKKTATFKAVKPATAATGLRAKPVRKPVTTATKSTKRSKEQTSDDEEEEKPRKIQRVLTPKKITQVARTTTPEDASEDELNGGKTPLRDLSMSPRRPQSAKMTEAVAKALSPVKPLDFNQSLLNCAQNATVASAENALDSPAKRPSSPAKLFIHSAIKSPVKVFNDELGNALASPAKRPVVSPVKEDNMTASGNASRLLFPSSTKRDQLTTFPQSATKLLQSPKRPATFDPSRIFAQSAIKPRSKDLSKSNFFSSPAKRHVLFSPLKQGVVLPTTNELPNPDLQPLDELDLNEMEITNLLEDGVVETSVTSWQRPSASPLRPLRLFEDEIVDELDDSILPVRSPMKVSKSPEKRNVVETNASQFEELAADEDMTEIISSVHNSPREHTDAEKSFVSLRAIEDGSGAGLESTNIDLAMVDADDDTIVLPESMIQTPHSNRIDMHEISQDELAISTGEDMMAKFVRIPGNTPRTPATLYEHELTHMLSSPELGSEEVAFAEGSPCTRPVSSPPVEDEVPVSVDTQLVEADTRNISSITNKQRLMQTKFSVSCKSIPSPASLHEHEMTLMGALGDLPDAPQSPVSISEHELTMMAERNNSEPNSSPVDPPQGDAVRKFTSSPPLATSPTFVIGEHELTIMGTESPKQSKSDAVEDVPAMAITKPATPSVPILRKFNINTVVTKIPLKPEGQESPIKLNIKKRKRPFSLGGNPEVDSVDFFAQPASAKIARTQDLQDAASPSHFTSAATPASNFSSRTITVGSARRAVSAPAPRSPLTPVVGPSEDFLDGVVVYVDVRTSEGADASAIYIDLLTNLGAKILKDWKDINPTHVIYKDGRPKTLEKVRVAAAEGLDLKCVGVSWPLDCEAQQTWLDETSYQLNLTSTEQILGSITKSARRKSMEPSMLIADGTGSVKRSRSRSRLSMGSRKSIVPNTTENTPSAAQDDSLIVDELATPLANAAKKQANAEKLSLTAAWKSINATQNLGEDTPARKTLDLLQRSYAAEQQDWDSTILSNEETDENAYSNGGGEENTPRLPPREANDDGDTSLIDTGLTPAPYRTKPQVGSAPSKITGAGGAGGFMSYRERVEEMERRELRDGARGVKGGQRGKKDGRRVTIFGN